MIRTLSFIFALLIVLNIQAKDKIDSLDLYFDLDKDILAATELNKIDSFLNENSTFIIYGYTDFLGSVAYNMDLSKRRAEFVKSHLLSLDVNADRITGVKFFGELPSNSNNPNGVREHRKVLLIRTTTIEEPVPEIVVKEEEPVVEEVSQLESSITESKAGENLVIENLNFIGGRHYLVEKSIPVARDLLKIMTKNPTLKIELQGHICCVSTLPKGAKDGLDWDTNEYKLSENRAKYIYDYLVKNGVSEDRLSYKGFGHSQPLADPEVTAEDQNRNRRVEIKIIEK